MGDVSTVLVANAPFLPGRVTDRVNEFFESRALAVLKLARLLVASGDIDVGHLGGGRGSRVFECRIVAITRAGEIEGDLGVWQPRSGVAVSVKEA